MKKEIERKFLLKDFPILSKVDEIQQINQYYYNEDNIWKRIRKIESDIFGLHFLHTIKTYQDGITFEEERIVEREEYVSLIKRISQPEYQTRFINKTRCIYLTGKDAEFEDTQIKNLKWEIDIFNYKLVIAEIELPSFDYPIDIPKVIQDKIIYEVTNIKEFSNRSLSEKLLTI
jgi:CYTH domain-containing protein